MEAEFDPSSIQWISKWKEACQKQGTSEILQQLCGIYCTPVYVYLRNKETDQAQAENSCQSFFSWFMNLNMDGFEDVEKQVFRKFVYTQLHQFIENSKTIGEHITNRPTTIPLNIPFSEHLLQSCQTSDLSDEVMFNHLWSSTLIQHTHEQLEADYRKKGNKVLYKSIRGVLSGEIRSRDYSRIAEKLDMPERTLKTSISRLKQRYRNKLKTLIGDTLLEANQVEEELNFLFSRI